MIYKELLENLHCGNLEVIEKMCEPRLYRKLADAEWGQFELYNNTIEHMEKSGIIVQDYMEIEGCVIDRATNASKGMHNIVLNGAGTKM